MSAPKPPLLVLAYGNPSRGDDALGPALIDLLAAQPRVRALVEQGELELLTDFQLQVEHALDLDGRRAVLIADAAAHIGGIQAEPLVARADASHSSHALSPQALLHTVHTLGLRAPPTTLLAMGAQQFGLGQPLSDTAQANLRAALEHALAWLAHQAGHTRHIAPAQTKTARQP